MNDNRYYQLHKKIASEYKVRPCQIATIRAKAITFKKSKEQVVKYLLEKSMQNYKHRNGGHKKTHSHNRSKQWYINFSKWVDNLSSKDWEKIMNYA